MTSTAGQVQCEKAQSGDCTTSAKTCPCGKPHAINQDGICDDKCMNFFCNPLCVAVPEEEAEK